MNTAKDSLDIFSEDEIFRYVAGQLDEQDTVRFEAKLKQDERLQKAVDEEKKLREHLVNSFEAEAPVVEPISADNLDALMAQIEKQESVGPESAEIISPAAFTSGRKNWMNYAGIAASIAAVAVVVLNLNSEPEYYLRSSPTEIGTPSYAELIKSERIVQLTLASNLSNDETVRLFEKYGLSLVSRAGEAWVMSSEEGLSADQLSKMENDPNFINVTLVSQ